MKKGKRLLSCMLGLLLLTGCSNSSSNIQTGNTGNQQRAIIAGIYFDGVYVQTYVSSWPIALDSYNIENDTMYVYGRFIPKRKDLNDIKQLENEFNYDTKLPYIISYSTTHDLKDFVYTNLNDASWKLNNLDDDNVCQFSLSIDLSRLVEQNKRLGRLVIGGDFYVNHSFDGEKI